MKDKKAWKGYNSQEKAEQEVNHLSHELKPDFPFSVSFQDPKGVPN